MSSPCNGSSELTVSRKLMESLQQARSVSSSCEFTVRKLSVLKMSPPLYNSDELSVSMMLAHTFTGMIYFIHFFHLISVCVNYWGNDAECDWWWYTGRAFTEPEFMMFNCLKSVTKCRPKDYVEMPSMYIKYLFTNSKNF